MYSHVKEHVPDPEANTTPVDRAYVCMWKNCSKKFSKKSLFHNHIHDHTGGMQDQFFDVLHKDQAKALTTPSRQMRWHPLEIKWCLRVYSKSHALYDDIRDSRFLKLPSGRTLSDYKNFCSSSSGWKKDRIMLMKEKLEKLTPNKSAKLGALVFDEVKKQEGLAFDPATWKLIGFTDLGEDEHNTSVTSACKPEENIATHVPQFFFRSLFSNFLAAQKLNRIFWQGVSLLHGFGLIILLSICDGASENRAFISMNGTNQFRSQGFTWLRN